MSPFSRRPTPSLWYVQPAPVRGVRPERTGPYTRDGILDLYNRGDLSGDVLVWTNERIFPDPDRPRSSRTVRIPEWRRWVRLPDPVRRELEDAARKRAAAAACAAREAAGGGAGGGVAALDPYGAQGLGGMDAGQRVMSVEDAPTEPPKYVSAVDIGGGGAAAASGRAGGRGRDRREERKVSETFEKHDQAGVAVTEADIGLDPYGDMNKI